MKTRREKSEKEMEIKLAGASRRELAANTSRVAAVISEGEALKDSKQYASEEIHQQLEMLETEWSKLQDASREKKTRLTQAYEAKKDSTDLGHIEAHKSD